MSTIGLTSPSNSSIGGGTGSSFQQQQQQTISYEKFAPRSNTQIHRLNRLAVLTAGPLGGGAVTGSTAPNVLTSVVGGGEGIMTNSTTGTNNTSHSRETVMMTNTATVMGGTAVTNFTISSFTREDEEPWNTYRRQNTSTSTGLDDNIPTRHGQDAEVKEGNDEKEDDDDDDSTDDPITQTLAQTVHLMDRCTVQWKHTTSLRLAVRACINIAEDISNRHAELIRHSGELSAAADRLQEEEQFLTRHAEEIGKPLKHYDDVDRIGLLVGVLFKGKNAVVRGLAKLKVDNEEEFPIVLDEIDSAIDYFGQQSGGKEALQAEMKRRSSTKTSHELISGNVEYFRRALLLQEAALAIIKEAVADRITAISAQIASALGIPQKTVAADQLEASLIYTRFHGISSRSNRLMGWIRARLHQGDAYGELFDLCRSTYCTQREGLLVHTVRAHMDKLKEQHGPVGMTRLASVFLIRFCTVETSLYLDFFGDKSATNTTKQKSIDDSTLKDSVFQAYLTNLCGALHRTVRRSLVTMLDLDTLCQIVSVLREERSMASSSPTTMAAARAISNVIEDAQERLIFCANSVLQREVIRFKTTPSDLDYPNKLKRTSPKEEPVDMEKRLEQVYETWFPPVRSVLKILSKIFRVVEPRVFEDIALQSVQSCTACLRSAATHIQSRKGVMHADLFMVKHLLILREQLSPFDIELRSVERQLDFSDAGKAMARFLANRNRRLFTMNASENALLQLLREGVSVQEASVDSKRDLEDALRTACNEFIDHTSKSLASELIQLVDDCKSSETTVLAQQAMLVADAVLHALTATQEKVDGSLNDITSQMGLYLDNPGTQSILLKPISRKIIRAAEELRKMIASIEGNGWNGEKKGTAETLLTSIEQLIKKPTKTGR